MAFYLRVLYRSPCCRKKYTLARIGKPGAQRYICMLQNVLKKNARLFLQNAWLINVTKPDQF
jgi:hypothetical protein